MKKMSLISACAVILIVLAALAIPAPAQGAEFGELAYDDGTCELYPMVHETQYLRQRFLVSDFGLSGDYLVETVRIYWGPTSGDFAGGIKLRDYDTGEVVTAVSFTQPVPGWHDYDVSGLGFVSDHFYVELWQISGYGYICGDTDPPHHSMSEVSTNSGETWHLFSDTDFMIRVIATPVIYDNTMTWVGNIVPCVVCEIGDEITLAGTQRIVTDFMFGYYGVFTPGGDETARIRFYANDGPEGVPGTLLYDSGTFPIMPGYDQTHTLTGLFVIVPDTFTWTCQFGGVTQWPGDLAALYLYDPPSVGSSEDYLWKSEGADWNKWDSPSTVDNLMARVTGVEELPPEEQIDRILDFFDTSVENESLKGDGPGNSAEKRLNALRNMIEAARDLIAAGHIDAACQQLQDVYNLTDGETPPPDFVTGDAASELATMILELIADLGC